VGGMTERKALEFPEKWKDAIRQDWIGVEND
jgi:hypothetical protein